MDKNGGSNSSRRIFNRMNDPAFQSSRIFVGGVAPDTQQDRLAKHFGRYGKVVGSLVMKGFAFVQFNLPEEAQAAIRSENGKEFMGQQIEVKAAKLEDRNNQRSGSGEGAKTTMMGSAGNAGGNGNAAACEIVCVDRYNRRYAEVVESRIQGLGTMQTDVIFPNPDIPLPKILGNMAARRVLLAVIVTPLNEEHRSVTLNILQGPTPQEHRNMPLDDALVFISKTFGNGMMMMTTMAGGGGPGSSGPPVQQQIPLAMLNQQGSSGIPGDVRTVLGFLLDQRPLSVMEYDKLIRFLAQKRDGVLREEYGDNIPHELAQPPLGPPLDPAVKAKQAELQERILNILNKPPPNPPKTANSIATAINFNSGNSVQQQQQVQQPQNLPVEIDPSLKRAIDNLIRTGPNLLSQVQNATTTAAANNAAAATTSAMSSSSMGMQGGFGGFGGFGSGSGGFPSYNPLKF